MKIKIIITTIIIAILTASFILIYRHADQLEFFDNNLSSQSQIIKLPDTMSIAFYNVENLFDFNLDGTEFDEYKPGWFGWTEEVQRTKLNNVAQVVAALDADVTALCEIENMNVLHDLQRALDRMGVVYPYSAVAPAPNSATVTALLSKFPIRETQAHSFGTGRNRTILEAKISRGADEFVVFVNHWPSKRSPESRRMAAAKVLRERIQNLPPQTDYLILGDLNANYNEFSTFHTAGFNDTEGRTGINHELRTIVYDATQPNFLPRFVCRNELDNCENCHYNLWLELDEHDRKSYIFRGARNTLDHILLPAALFDSVGFSYLAGSFGVFTWDGKLMRDGVPWRWQMRWRGSERYHVGAGFSDHLPIYARIVRANILSENLTNRGTGGDNFDINNLGDVNNLGDKNNVIDGVDVLDVVNVHQNQHCIIPDPNLRHGDFAITVDGWVSGDSRFVVERDTSFARTGTHSLRVSGVHPTENRTAARVRLPVNQNNARHVTMSIRGFGNLSIRLRRTGGNWENYNGPDFQSSRSIRYRPWRNNNWRDLRFALPAGDRSADVEIELRTGRGVPLAAWVDRVRVE